ncbi:alpha/beta hydrolase [Lacrimispora sp. NSJ-141]|uniref:Alpha/beta hydrolase n=1 Tax=Lientehia hominis TaxID=2897778 RepID=A0AAP2RHP1_9FIRM|nr:alpha/beta hydrolase [Lientehia hominis]MCD2491478.1 alpha/beta hydrolase [Lientehia hominis]
MKTGRETEEDFRLHYTEKGEGMPLVLLHGNGEDGSYFVRQIEFFSREYRVIAVDTRGHGQSPRGAAPFTLEQFAEDLRQFLDEMGLSRILLLGFSDGANIAMIFALKYPEYLEKMVLNGGNLRPSGVRAGAQLPIVLGYAMVAALSLLDKKLRRKKELLGLMVTEPHISKEELLKLCVPTLVIAGTKDMIKASHTREIHESIPDSCLCFLKGSHFIACEQPEEFNQTVYKFLKEK